MRANSLARPAQGTGPVNLRLGRLSRLSVRLVGLGKVGRRQRCDRIAIDRMGTLVQGHLVVAAHRHLDLVAGVTEQVLRIDVHKVARVVLVDFGNHITAEQLRLGRAVVLYLVVRGWARV
uniref:Uncharacterized protein n=1 Tax=Anopheles merus TaxID=30066 RepID=A0A182VF00_ANOME